VLRRYVHLSTGNYNPRTARLYTDIGYLTADPALTADADAVFQQLASQAQGAAPQHLVTAPFQLHRRCWRTSTRWPEAAARRAAGAHRRQDQCADRPGADRGAAARRPGRRRIDLIVRGACMLPPGVPGVSDNIRVRSVVGRFLEHSRISTSAGARATTTRCCT
jgi:polyphosphate kinase